MAVKNKSNEIKLVRIYDAPVKTVWDAFTETKHVEKWWGPRGFTLTTHSKDLKTGGHWNYTMHGPDGKDWPNKTTYLEVEMYSRMVYDHGANDTQPPLFRVTANFVDLKGKTKLELSFKFATAEAAEETGKFIKKAGGESTWDRLAEYLEKEKSNKEIFVINRSFDAPLETVFDVWTNPKHFSKWLAPAGFEMEFIKADIRPGGNTFYCMSNPQMKMYGKAQYIEVEEGKRIVYTQQFADEKGNTSRHPMAPTWPETMLTVVTFNEEGPDRTRITITWEPHGKVSAEEMDMFIKARSGMPQGWTGSFDKLESYLEGLS
jgi:uncharacterized protein YndB with AHSA1/START domain